MSIVSELTESKEKLDALLTYANGVTGAADANIGDAIKTLCDGFGGGGGAKWELVSHDRQDWIWDDFVPESLTPTTTRQTIAGNATAVTLTDQVDIEHNTVVLIFRSYLDVQYLNGAPTQKTRGHIYPGIVQLVDNRGNSDVFAGRPITLSASLYGLYDNASGVLSDSSSGIQLQIGLIPVPYVSGKKVIRLNNIGRPNVFVTASSTANGRLDANIWSYIDRHNSRLSFEYWYLKAPLSELYSVPNPYVFAALLANPSKTFDYDVCKILTGKSLEEI